MSPQRNNVGGGHAPLPRQLSQQSREAHCSSSGRSQETGHDRSVRNPVVADALRTWWTDLCLDEQQREIPARWWPRQQNPGAAPHRTSNPNGLPGYVGQSAEQQGANRSTRPPHGTTHSQPFYNGSPSNAETYSSSPATSHHPQQLAAGQVDQHPVFGQTVTAPPRYRGEDGRWYYYPPQIRDDDLVDDDFTDGEDHNAHHPPE